MSNSLPPPSQGAQPERRRPAFQTRRSSKSSVGLRRLGSSTSLRRLASETTQPSNAAQTDSNDFAPRRRSSSEPQPPQLPELPFNRGHIVSQARTRTDVRPNTVMPRVSEESARPEPFPSFDGMDAPSNGERPNTMPPVLEEPGARTNEEEHGQNNPAESQAPGRRRKLTRNTPSVLSIGNWGRGRNRATSNTSQASSHTDLEEDLVNLLDVIDPEVATLSTLTNVQNSLFVPDLGRWTNRRPTYTLNTRQSGQQLKVAPPPSPPPKDEATRVQDEVDESAAERVLERAQSMDSIDSNVSQSRYAVLPHGVRLEGWTDSEKAELNDHVRHLLHSRRAAFKRGLRGFGQYVRRPLGLFVTVYATTVTVFGLVWVLFLIGWVSAGARNYYVINVIDNVLVALFALMGDGLAPFRAVDTYHMIFIAHYHHLTWKLRKQKALPELPNHNDLPAVVVDDPEKDLEVGKEDGDDHYYSVLTAEQQKKLEHHQKKFSKSHTFYKPHETETHFAFPVRLLIAIVVLLDCHSIFQLTLGPYTWSHEDYVNRSFAITTAVLCCSLTCNITGGILISVGDHKTRKKDVKERMFRQQLTEDAIHQMEKRKRREQQRNMALEQTVTPEEGPLRVDT
ncbi:hypothetical protein MBLNU457_4678t1 [Dothideomycetes sp. NU457]